MTWWLLLLSWMRLHRFDVRNEDSWQFEPHWFVDMDVSADEGGKG